MSTNQSPHPERDIRFHTLTIYKSPHPERDIRISTVPVYQSPQPANKKVSKPWQNCSLNHVTKSHFSLCKISRLPSFTIHHLEASATHFNIIDQTKLAMLLTKVYAKRKMNRSCIKHNSWLCHNVHPKWHHDVQKCHLVLISIKLPKASQQTMCPLK